MKRLMLIGAAALAVAAARPAPRSDKGDPEDARAPVPERFFRLSAAVRIPGKNPDWDYLAFDSERQHLFIARRGAGLWVFDTARQKMLRQIANSDGAGATLVISALNRGYSTNEDGSTTVFDLATLATIKRVNFGHDADAASFDPVTGRIAFIAADSRTVFLVDARSLKTVASVQLEAKKADGSAVDGLGHILLNERDRNMVAQIDAASGKILSEWPTTGCEQPTGMAVDVANHRAFIGCRSAHPVLAVLDTDNGHVVATLPLGRGNDGVVYDPRRHRVITTNGIEGNLVVFRQDGPDAYRLDQAITTRPMARTLAYDITRGKVFTVTAEGVVNPAQPVNSGPSPFYPNAYYDNSFVVLTYVAGRGG